MKAIPVRLGPLELKRSLGVHGSIASFEAVRLGSPGFARRVLARVTERPYAGGSDAEHRLVEEAHLSMALSHPALLPVLELEQYEGRVVSLREWVDGVGLRGLLARSWAAGRAVPPAAVLRAGVQVARALIYLHGARVPAWGLHGVAHRAVSPSNVLISRAGEVRLANLFLARPLGRSEAAPLLASTPDLIPAFRAPEIGTGAPADLRSDVYSLAAVVYEALMGPEVFRGDPSSDWSRFRDGDLSEAAAQAERLPATLRSLLASALAADPDRRPPDVDVLRDGFRRALRDLYGSDGTDELQAAVAAAG